jgi:hypothetical protein
MRDLLADWHRWTPAERIVAAALTITVVAVPLAAALRAVV